MSEIKAPLWATIEITGQCNLDCSYCHIDSASKSYISINCISNLIDRLSELGVWNIVISGGEPFLHPEIFEIIEKLRDSKNLIGWEVLTNGTIFSHDHKTERLASVLDGKDTSHFQVSLDSIIPEINDKVRGKTKRVLRGIENLVDRNIYPTIGTVVSKSNIENIRETIVHLFETYNLTHFHLMNLINIPNHHSSVKGLRVNKKKLRIFWEELSKLIEYDYPKISIESPHTETDLLNLKSNLNETIGTQKCTAGWTGITITSDLDILPCSLARNVVMGNLNNASIEEIWQSEAAKDIRQSENLPCQV